MSSSTTNLIESSMNQRESQNPLCPNLIDTSIDEAPTAPTGSSTAVSSVPTPFVPTLGAWTKPLHFTPPATPPEPATPRSTGVLIQGEQENSIWPSLYEGLRKGKTKHKLGASKLMPNLPVEKLPPPALKEDGSLRFPWAAKMNPSSRNLFRAADPTFRIDGTPQVTIPSRVLLLGPENHDEYVVGNFFRCSSPSGGLVHAVVNRLWGRSCKITSRKVGDSSFIFHIPHEGTRSWVVQRGVWHIDDCLLFVAPWSPAATFDVQEIATIPVWVNLTKIPDRLYSRLGISHIASGLGEPMMTHKPYLDPTLMGEAKILVEVELDKPFPKQIALDDKQGHIFLVDVNYTWIPSVCERCGQLGHKEKRCLLPANDTTHGKKSKKVESEQENVSVVDVHHLLEHAAQIVASQNLQETALGDHNVDTSSSKNQVEQTDAHEHINSAPTSTKSSEELDSQSRLAAPTQRVQLPTYQTQVQDPIVAEDTLTAHSSQEVEVTTTLFSTPSISLAAFASAPKLTTTMESSPSTTIRSEISNQNSEADPISGTANLCQQTPSHDSREDILPYDLHVDGERESDQTCHSTLGTFSKMTRGGRPIKPTQKVQEMEWITVGRGNRGRRGHGANINPS